MQEEGILQKKEGTNNQITMKQKFNIGDKAWVMERNKPTEITVDCVFITRERVRYGCKNSILSFGFEMYDSAFATKEELLKSL